ncbi:ATPase, F1 complex, gamma subunit domain-containing protein [Tricharina praecox]|uniref:ATPase, F1 complex, gamma subunit domain-containing protein n=1 Tax=Tricharina praecox TaxID=43433 RepID=UPI002220A0B3|nr:ATPase, F1 complex, gamma subunit domain-containing protein [Tricharina praecox]KAI5842065.1 ATPase, F1 complex, gamma subunit domain-containing protein [Tricharina praecox]
MLSRAARPALQRAAAASCRPVLSNNYATLREIEGRLKSIKNIEKITKTMKIVASTKMNQAQKSMAESRIYGKTSNKLFEEAEAQPSETGKTLYIVSSSDKGLCGGVHSSLSKAVRLKLLANENADLVVMGEKCRAQLGRSNARNMVLSFSGIGKDVPTFATAQAIANQIMALDTEYDNVEIVYNSFLTPVSYEATTMNAYSEESMKAAANISAFEIEDEQLPNLREFALANSIYWALAEGYACEIAARRNAMDNASKNAGEMIGKFQILYNRTRQAVITGELVEIITGAAASAE